MVDLDRGKIIIGDKEEPIKKFEVWFMTPYGLCNSYDQAQTVIRERLAGEDVPLNACLTPVPVAVSETLYEIMLSR